MFENKIAHSPRVRSLSPCRTQLPSNHPIQTMVVCDFRPFYTASFQARSTSTSRLPLAHGMISVFGILSFLTATTAILQTDLNVSLNNGRPTLQRFMSLWEGYI